ncbi:hypothetical protein Rumeso_04852 [Rubellimicrobium mesophilum DSM 19309]|uniref:Uncharacterized protein n=1 Tax=Rubellimicrobium mesophilum DSM 19309 TaxID=442562 RepID=A0A017HCV5_9RHOB|nr:hypothetical protein Rumeso_04852 [Rubellimicrobium mesophilum DSM 19309]
MKMNSRVVLIGAVGREQAGDEEQVSEEQAPWRRTVHRTGDGG